MYLPTIRIKKDQLFLLRMTLDDNISTLWTNMHFHGSNKNPFNDGASTLCEFGVETILGSTQSLLMAFPNNSGYQWYHTHNSQDAAPFVYGGVAGFVEIIDRRRERVGPATFSVREQFFAAAPRRQPD